MDRSKTDVKAFKALYAIARSLEKAAIPYAVIGGFAVSVRAEPRFTNDVDVVVAVDPKKPERLVTQLVGKTFEAWYKSEDAREWVRKLYLLPLRHRATGVRVDVSLGVTGFDGLIIERADITTVVRRKVPVATSEDLIIMKLIAGRSQDHIDVDSIVDRNGPDLDWEYLLDIGGQLQQALAQDLVPQLKRLRIRAQEGA